MRFNSVIVTSMFCSIDLNCILFEIEMYCNVIELSIILTICSFIVLPSNSMVRIFYVGKKNKINTKLEIITYPSFSHQTAQ